MSCSGDGSKSDDLISTSAAHVNTCYLARQQTGLQKRIVVSAGTFPWAQTGRQ